MANKLIFCVTFVSFWQSSVCPSRSRHASTMLQVCLVGTGRMGQLRAPILYANPRAELSYVVDVVEEAAGQLAAVYQCGEQQRKKQCCWTGWPHSYKCHASLRGVRSTCQHVCSAAGQLLYVYCLLFAAHPTGRLFLHPHHPRHSPMLQS